MKKKILALCVVISLAAVAIIGDKEPISGGYLWASNVTLSGTEGNTPDAKNSGWTGEYFSDEQIQEDAKTYKDGYFKTTSEKMVPGRNVRKNPYVINNGKNDAYVRETVCSYFGYLGVEFDAEANNCRGKEVVISKPESKVKVAIIPTNEELAICRETVALV